MDNFGIDITAEGRASLEKALEIAFAHNCPGGTVSHYKVVKFKRETRYYGEPKTTHHFSDLKEHQDGIPTLLLLWHEGQEATEHLFAMDLAETLGFVNGWLNKVDFGKEPDHDGSNGKGWRVFTETWGRVAGYSYTVCAVQPAWAMYGK
jgi:hypothetical protein